MTTGPMLRRLSVVAVALFVFVAAVSGGYTLAVFTDSRDVAVVVSVNGTAFAPQERSGPISQGGSSGGGITLLGSPASPSDEQSGDRTDDQADQTDGTVPSDDPGVNDGQPDDSSTDGQTDDGQTDDTQTDGQTDDTQTDGQTDDGQTDGQTDDTQTDGQTDDTQTTDTQTTDGQTDDTQTTDSQSDDQPDDATESGSEPGSESGDGGGQTDTSDSPAPTEP